jgi:hypothetical protein
MLKMNCTYNFRIFSRKSENTLPLLLIAVRFGYKCFRTTKIYFKQQDGIVIRLREKKGDSYGAFKAAG